MLAVAGALFFALASPADQAAFDRCESKREPDPEHWRGYVCYYVHARKTGAYDPTIARVRALAATEPKRTWFRYILADLLADQGDPGAGELYRSVSNEFEQAGDYESATLSRLAYAGGMRDASLDERTHELEHARRVAAKKDDPVLSAQVDVQHARLLSKSGTRFALAADLLARTRTVAFPDGPYELKKHILFVEARLAEGQDDAARSLHLNEELRDIAEAAGDRYVKALAQQTAIRLQASYPVFRRDASWESLESATTEARRAAIEADNPFAAASAECTAGDVSAVRETALGWYQRCLESGRELSLATAEHSALIGIALSTTDPSVAEREVDRALALGRSRGRDSMLALAARARVAFARQDRSAALRAATELFDHVDISLAHQGDPATQARLLASFNPYYYEMAQHLVGDELDAGPDDISAALIIIERMRARMIATSLIASKSISAEPQDPRRAAIGREITSINRRLRVAELDDPQRTSLLASLDALESEDAGLRDLQDATNRPPPIALPAIPSLTELQAQLEPDQALLSFHLTRAPIMTRWEHANPVSWLAVVTADDIRLHPLPPRDVIEPLADLFAGLFSGKGASADETASGLYHTLLGAALSELPSTIGRLVIIPDGSLHHLPFAALGPEYGRSLAQRFELTIAPSIAVWSLVRNTPDGPTNGSALAIVDPTVGGDPATTRAAGLGPTLSLGRLPFARDEAGSLARVADTVIRAGADASEAFVRDANLGDYDVVHFAAHAIVDDAHPERASIVLAPGSEELDGLLQPRELFGSSFGGSLVVLAACQSAGGPVLGGEGPLGLAQALFGGGARTVVATLWRIRDDDAAAFFGLFYARLGQGRSVAASVAYAQRELQALGAPPAAWAGIVVLGDGDYAPLQAPRNWGWWYGAAGLLLLGVAITLRQPR